ncbi:hypothetical protein [Mongoliibacter ruber]|uniref:Uncharacterized protein n=1 Tax=Mongoliibacter ruber TaxID=1750599 RepID=A0A2T0WEW8_9BACT|nr:hypothetical protein [Mongoliibacter ruber]PRY85263.1 hypothetical protein CLW00_11310 [Mongoliibacter ruber]
MKKLLFLFFCIITLPSFSQNTEWGQPAVINFPRLGLLSIDNQGFIFISDLEGNLYQYNNTGIRVNNFSPQRQGALSQLEAAWTVNIFTFSADLQEYRILDRFINPVSENRIPLHLITLAKVATLGNNNIIWVFDEADLTLKQLDFRQQRIVQNQPLNLVLTQSSLRIVDIREYQNMVFLNIEDEGIYILDNQANFLQQIPIELSQKLSFWKGELVYIKDQELILFSLKNRSNISFPIPEGIPAQNVAIDATSVIFYNHEKVWIFPKNQTLLKDK